MERYLNGLSQFFDTDRFMEGKRFQVTACREWKGFETDEHLGTRVEVVIVADNTKYRESSNGTVVSNLFEKMIFKVSRNITVPVGALVVPVDAVATVYGERHNQLSVKCADIKVLAVPKGKE